MMGFDTSTPQPQQDGSPALVKWSLGQSLQHFRLQVRRLVKVLCPLTQHRCLIGQAKGQPLLHLGITTHIITLPISIPLTAAAETELAIRIIPTSKLLLQSSHPKATSEAMGDPAQAADKRQSQVARQPTQMARQAFPTKHRLRRTR